MASAVIHLAVAKKVNEVLKLNEKELLIGSIAPDISSQLKLDRDVSHFIEDSNNIVLIHKFLNKYKDHLTDPFVMGYYIHLLTDYYWTRDFIPKFKNEESITFSNGVTLALSEENVKKILYQDYTNINISVIDSCNLNLKIFYEDVPIFKNIIKEIPMDKIEVVVDAMGLIIANSYDEKTVLFDMTNINYFIHKCTKDILNDIVLEFVS